MHCGKLGIEVAKTIISLKIKLKKKRSTLAYIQGPLCQPQNLSVLRFIHSTIKVTKTKQACIDCSEGNSSHPHALSSNWSKPWSDVFYCWGQTFVNRMQIPRQYINSWKTKWMKSLFFIIKKKWFHFKLIK